VALATSVKGQENMDATTLIVALVGSNALFAFVQYLITRHDNKVQRKEEKKNGSVKALEDINKKLEEGQREQKRRDERIESLSVEIDKTITMIQGLKGEQEKQGKSLMGLGHDRIVWLGSKAIQAGFISTADYDSIYNYLYLPYKALGGNGTAEKIMEDLKDLPAEPEKAHK
jgi:hypothetical protein